MRITSINNKNIDRKPVFKRQHLPKPELFKKTDGIKFSDVLKGITEQKPC